MTPGTAALVAAVVVAVVLMAAFWAYHTAQRLDRLNIRTDSTRHALQAALDRRAAVLSALNPEVADVTARAEAIPLTYGNFGDRAAAERDISAIIADYGSTPPTQIVDANVRLELAHRFYNEAVADTRALSLAPVVRRLRLGGTAKLPEFFEFMPG